MLLEDKNGTPILEGSYVLIGHMSSGMSQPGRVHIGKVLGKTGRGLEIEGFPNCCKTPHRLTVVPASLAEFWIDCGLNK